MAAPPLSAFSARRADGRETPLAEFAGQVLLVVNTASACGFTPQYAGLEALQRDYGPRGFSVLAFPCNQFGGQEPGDEASIAQFCETRFNATFPLFAKVEVNGEGAHPLFRHLKAQKPGVLGTEAIKWNFTKFLIDRQGRVAGRFAPATAPEKLRSEIERLLAADARQDLNGPAAAPG
ncbi:glutathione peroxidase [Pseudoroseomonas rhizosphaerae]|uniref:Glutathione peroxidase n=1 Tax=Teichococcus rhizosphaerae TaxID=1335062 RepID=A0A2C7ABE1_9PROT|nr:glutathione peroxidase [Pseudoroseomonas rhizosphaerae]PHK94725.1 glutathione peroxidase [Pseudoroseomonas rhizosphaerae]